MNYKEFLVPVSIAKELKEIGFNEPCLFVLNPHNTLILSSEVHDKGIIEIRKIKSHSNGKLGEDFYSVPTYEQVFKWFRVRGLIGEIRCNNDINNKVINFFITADNINSDSFDKHFLGEGESYEKLREILLERMIKIYIIRNIKKII